MANGPTLKIKRVIRVSHFKGWCAIAFTFIIMILGPLIMVENYHFSAALRYGDITKKLLHDVEQAYPSPGPFLSSWLEHPIFIKDTTYYTNPVSDDLNNLEIYPMLFSWKTFFMLCLKLIDDWFRTGDFIFEVTTAEFKAHWIKYLRFLSISSAFAFLLVFGTDGGFNIIYQLTRDNIVDWLEKSYVSIEPNDTGMNLLSTQKPHPLTGGLSSPFFLREEFRFVGEDVQFVCEYKVLGAQNVQPIFVSSWWLKNGIPVKNDERQCINVTVTADEDRVEKFGMRWFIIRNTLTITMVERQHFGTYACVYRGPMIKKKIIFETSGFWEKETFSAPKSYHSKYGNSYINTYDLAGDNIRKCFGEFKLKKRSPKRSTFYVNVNIGGIVKEFFTYSTLADPFDVSVDVTFLDSTSTQCCSLISKLYWIFFKGGCIVDLPYARIMWSNESSYRLIVSKWMCVCKDIPRMHTNTIYRTIYNATLKSWQTMDIKYPVSLFINTSRNETQTFLESLQFCKKNSPPYTLCGFLDMILENKGYTVYGVDVFIIAFVVFLFIVFKIATDWSKFYVAIPLRKACFCSFTTLPIQFEALNGPHLKRLRNKANIKGNRGDHDEVKNDPVYDIFLSYCNEDAYDRAVAQHFKTIAIDIGLTVFDPHKDIMAGQMVLKATSAAIHRSSRFVIFASDAYKQDGVNAMEFDAINDTIKSQTTIAKHRLLVFRVGGCVVDGLHRVSCIPIPGSARVTYSLDESCQIRFKEWERATRPDSTKVPAPYTWLEWLRYCGFNWKSVIFIFVLFILCILSTLFATYQNLYL